MSPKPTGHLRPTPGAADLVIQRSFEAPIDDVWQSVTASESTARWIGPWQGEPGPGKTVTLTMTFEEGAPTTNVAIETCEPPERLIVCTKDDYGEWRLELALKQEGSTTRLIFTHHLTDLKMVGEVGPGWEYYLDMLVAARLGRPLPKFADYYPSQRAYYVEQAEALAQG